MVNEAIVEGVHSRHSLTADEFVRAMKSPEQKGSIVFSRLNPNASAVFNEHGGGTGVQTIEDVIPFKKMQLPSNITYTPNGVVYAGSRISGETLIAPEFNDWMKTFAQNIKETAGPGALLPKGTQELLDTPTMEEGSRALRAYLESTGQTSEKPNARLTTIMPDEEGIVNFVYDQPDGTTGYGRTYRERVDKFVTTTDVSDLADDVLDKSKGLNVGTKVTDLTTSASLAGAEGSVKSAPPSGKPLLNVEKKVDPGMTTAGTTRAPIPMGENQVNLYSKTVKYDTKPMLDKKVLELWQNRMHAGTSIKMMSQVSEEPGRTAYSALERLDPRALDDMPDEIARAIDEGQIESVFVTDPKESLVYKRMSKEEKAILSFSDENVGSIYLRKHTGETARWKLPEISESGADAGWKASSGAEYFSEATVYTNDTRPISTLNELNKTIAKDPEGWAAANIDAKGMPKTKISPGLQQTLDDFNQAGGVSAGNIERIKRGEKYLIGLSNDLVDTPPKKGTTVNKALPQKQAKALDELKTGKPAPVKKTPTPHGKKVNPVKASAAVETVQAPTGVTGNIVTDATNAIPVRASQVDDIVRTVKKAAPDALDTAKNVARGNATGMGIAAAAILLGVGAMNMNQRKKIKTQNRATRREDGGFY